MNDENKDEAKPKTGGSPAITPRSVLYSRISKYVPKAIEAVVELLDSRNPSVRIAAARTILDRTLPELKAVEVTGENGEPIRLNIIAGRDYLSKLVKIDGTSTGSTVSTSPQIQGSSMAQASTEDNDSNNTTSELDSA